MASTHALERQKTYSQVCMYWHSLTHIKHNDDCSAFPHETCLVYIRPHDYGIKYYEKSILG